jgi:hypothetical protein
MSNVNDDLTSTYCINCGAQAKAVEQFCHDCGLPVYRGTSSEETFPSPTQPFPQVSTELMESASTPMPSSAQNSAEAPGRKEPLTPSVLGISSQPEVRINIEELRTRSTLSVVLLSIVTWFVWPVHFLYSLTLLINASAAPSDRHLRISDKLVVTSFVLAYMSLALLAVTILVPASSSIAIILEFATRASGVCMLIWSFQVRNRLNTLLQSTTDSKSWFHGFYTVCFVWIYINYKLNKLKEANQISSQHHKKL